MNGVSVDVQWLIQLVVTLVFGVLAWLIVDLIRRQTVAIEKITERLDDHQSRLSHVEGRLGVPLVKP